jgi:DNA (cytosine-5)-methyltransferase 1
METSNKLIGEQLSLWTSSVVDTPANHLAKQENEKEQTTQDTCGLGCERPLANYDPNTQSWKTLEDISLWGEQQSLETLPKSGMTRNGELYQQLAWEPVTDETASSLLHTPTAKMNQLAPSMNSGWWPTPTADDASNVNPKPNRFRGLVAAVNEQPTWPTPTTQEIEHPNAQLTATGRRKSKTSKSSYSLGLADSVLAESPNGGKLNPTWVEWLMGFPTGWTDLED